MTKKHLPPKILSLFFIYGILYMTLEVVWRAISSYEDDIGMMVLSDVFSRPALMGYTSLWMGLVGALSGVALGSINEVNWIKHNLNMFWQAVTGAVVVLTVEFATGLICNMWLGLDIWNYSQQPLNILGQVCLPSLGIWFLLSPFAFWFDDFVKWCLYDEVTDLKSLWRTYLECLMPWKKV
jgi:uncharacterized membrane protein